MLKTVSLPKVDEATAASNVHIAWCCQSGPHESDTIFTRQEGTRHPTTIRKRFHDPKVHLSRLELIAASCLVRFGWACLLASRRFVSVVFTAAQTDGCASMHRCTLTEVLSSRSETVTNAGRFRIFLHATLSQIQILGHRDWPAELNLLNWTSLFSLSTHLVPPLAVWRP